MIDQKEGEQDSIGIYVQIFAALFVVLIIGSIFMYYSTSKDLKTSCGDGTALNNCSLNAPYFCLNGTLVPQSSICGCPEGLISKGDLCLSDYHVDPKIVELNYILRGEQEKIDFIVYNGMSDYIANISRTIRYSSGEVPSLDDFKSRNINDEVQREWILPLVVQIQNVAGTKEDQARIAISVVQNIPFGRSNLTVLGFENRVNYARYPYEVLYDVEGVCSEKSELLYMILKEMGYGVVFLEYSLENHEALGVKCPVPKSMDDTGYCFIETTAPAIVSDDKIIYRGGIKLSSIPKFIFPTNGSSFAEDLYEYGDAKSMIKLRNKIETTGKTNYFQHWKLESLKEKYGFDGHEYNL